MKAGVLIPNNQGLVTTTAVATGDLVHQVSTGRKAKIRKIMFYQNTGNMQTLIFGTNDNTAPALFVPLFPTINCINGQAGGWPEELIPDVIFSVDRRLLALGSDGNIYVVSSVAGILVRCEIEER